MDQTGSGSWPTTILIYLLSVMAMMVVSEGVPVLGGIAAEFHPRSPAMIGLVMSLPALVAGLGALGAGWIVDRFGDRRVLLAGGLVMISGDVGAATAGGIETLLAWRIVGGMGYVGMAVASVAMIGRTTGGRRRVAALALWSTVIPASFILSFLAGAMLPGPDKWRWIFAGHALATAALLIVGAVALPQAGRGESRLAGLSAVLRTPGAYLLGVSFAAGAFLQTGMVAVLPKLLGAKIGASEAAVHSFGIVAMMCNLGGALGVGALLNRGVAARTIGLSGMALALAGVGGLLSITSSLAQAVVFDCLMMLGCGLLAGMWALLPRVAPSPQSFGATSGLITQVTLWGVLFGPPAAFAALATGPLGTIVQLTVFVAGTLAAWPVWVKQSPGSSGPVAH